jgi:hypothetical protein
MKFETLLVSLDDTPLLAGCLQAVDGDEFSSLIVKLLPFPVTCFSC